MVFALTLFLVIKKPFGVGIGWPAWLGASACLLLELINLEDILYIASLVWDATLAFVFFDIYLSYT